MIVFNDLQKFILLPIYYIIHKNYVFGFFHKFFIRKFYYKNLKFELNIKNIPLENYSSFLFKTYEYNDRVLIIRHISHKNKSIVLGGGIGFIPTLVFKNSMNKILVFEVNKKIVPNLKKNLIDNKVKFSIYNNNLVYKKTKNKVFYFTKDFLSTSAFSKTLYEQEVIVKNIEKKKIRNFDKFNTLILDIEGDEEYYIKNINKFKNIKYLFFELHHNIIKEHKIIKLMKILKLNKFILQDKCFNSYYFKKKF
jgi:hypothetical protein